ncbi:carbohydrate porin [Novosphingobium resinovorum]|uniref:carbohydrate porin n=1 Tax=Novosphingobium resinovorum TaxID=158500 RepID=UPI002ED19EB2|nr:carbohydrate porin [Novosphingobium resinovorum]
MTNTTSNIWSISQRSALLCACAAVLCGLPAFAQEDQGQSAGDPPVEKPATTSALPDDDSPPAPAVAPDADRFKRFDDLSLKGWAISYPKVADTILADHGGVRDALADVGIGISPINTANFQYDFLQNDRGYDGPQLYNGQDVTRTNTTISFTATYDLGQIGIKGGQIATTLAIVDNSFPEVNGPKKIRIGRLHYYQSLFDGKVDFKLGYIDNTQEFLGINVGGNLATGNLGPQATIPFQLGLSYGGFAAPGFNTRVKFGEHFYNKIGFQRSLPPGGATAENRVNSGGFRFRPPGTGLLVIDEVGFNRPAAPGQKSMWVRGGGIYNTTKYPVFGGGQAENWAAFLAVDRQLTQPDSEKPFRGIYAGATVNYAPPRQNLYTQYYEARLYAVGMLKGRPFDLASLVTTYNKYSPAGLRARTAPDQRNYAGTLALIASYAYRVRAGIYLQPGLGVTMHPIYSSRFGTALNGYLSLVTLF